MKLRTLQFSLVGVVGSVIALALVASGQEPGAKQRKVVKTDAEWRKLLSKDQYAVTREAGTEPAGSGKLLHNKAHGIYECVGCGTPLFSWKTKFDSGTGWPSFYAPYDQKNIDTSTDYKLGYARTEVLCNTCGAHLGHVFDDGPAPTGLRFCMNSLALKFEKDPPPATKEKTAKEKTEKTDKTDKVEKKDTPEKNKPATNKSAIENSNRDNPASSTPK